MRQPPPLLLSPNFSLRTQLTTVTIALPMGHIGRLRRVHCNGPGGAVLIGGRRLLQADARAGELLVNMLLRTEGLGCEVYHGGYVHNFLT